MMLILHLYRVDPCNVETETDSGLPNCDVRKKSTVDNNDVHGLQPPAESPSNEVGL